MVVSLCLRLFVRVLFFAGLAQCSLAERRRRPSSLYHLSTQKIEQCVCVNYQVVCERKSEREARHFNGQRDRKICRRSERDMKDKRKKAQGRESRRGILSLLNDKYDVGQTRDPLWLSSSLSSFRAISIGKASKKKKKQQEFRRAEKEKASLACGSLFSSSFHSLSSFIVHARYSPSSPYDG